MGRCVDTTEYTYTINYIFLLATCFGLKGYPPSRVCTSIINFMLNLYIWC
jgi:hypothetical protein